MMWVREPKPDRHRRWLPAEVASRIFHVGEGWMHIGDGSGRKIDVESQQMEVLHGFKPHGVAKEAGVDQGLDGRVM